MKCPKCKGSGRIVVLALPSFENDDICPICKGTGKVKRTDGIDYNRKIAVPEHRAKS